MHIRRAKFEDARAIHEVMGLYFTPEAKGAGLGRQMMQLIEEEARSEGCHTLILNSAITSLAFYKKMGFQEAGPRFCHAVRGVDIPCCPMEKKL